MDGVILAAIISIPIFVIYMWFLDLLSEATKQNPNFHLIATMTEMDKSHREWKGETGSINKDMLTRHLALPQGPTYYLAGPPSMVAAMRRMLIEAEVDEDDIRTEEFSVTRLAH